MSDGSSHAAHAALLAHHLSMLDFELKATARTLEGLARAKTNVENAGLASLAPPLERAIGVMSHVAAARTLWLSRIDAAVLAPADGVFPIWDLETCVARTAETDEAWSAFAARLRAQDLERSIAYRALDGTAYSSTVAEILAHVVNHGSYHRGQAAMLIAQTGTRPPGTDLIGFTRVARAEQAGA